MIDMSDEKINITLLSPRQGENISLLSEVQRAFLENDGNKNKDVSFDYLNLVKQNENNTLPAPVVFKWQTNITTSEKADILLYISNDASFSSFVQYRCEKNELSVFNLNIGRRYYWRVCAVDNKNNTVFASDVQNFFTEYTPPRAIFVDGLGNVRDIGGWKTNTNKRIKQGLVYRGCEMEFHYTLSEEGRRTMAKTLNIKTDLDLRAEAEGKIAASAIGEGCTLKLIPSRAYDEFVEDKDVCKNIFSLFTDEQNYPFYVHCWGGADRTGTVMFLLGGLLGVEKKDLFLDYELSTLSIWGDRSSNSEAFVRFLNSLDQYGTNTDTINEKCEKYLLSCGLTQNDINKIRTILL